MGGSARETAAEAVEFTAGGLALLPPYVSLRRLTRWTAGLLATTGGLAAVSLGVELSQLRLLLQPVEGEGALWIARAAHSATGGTLLALRIATFTATATLFLAWVYHARANVRALGVRRPRFTRGWAVGAFFVPGLNVVRPHAVLAEIWQASDPAFLDPFGWRGARVPRLLWIWWSMVVAWAAVVGMAVFTEATAGLILGRLRLAAALSALADLWACAAVGLTWLVVLRLAETQQAKWERVRAGGAGAAVR